EVDSQGVQRVAKAPRFRGNPFLPACAGQKFLPPNIPLGTKFGTEPRTRPIGLAHSQCQISLYVSRPYAHVVRSGLFWQFTGLAGREGRLGCSKAEPASEAAPRRNAPCESCDGTAASPPGRPARPPPGQGPAGWPPGCASAGAPPSICRCRKPQRRPG